MSDKIEVGRSGELEDGTMKEVLVRGREVLLARIGSSYYIGLCFHNSPF